MLAFDSIVISIGLYHHGKHSFANHGKAKWRFLDYILEANSKKNLNDYLKGLREIYPQAKSYYSYEIKIASHKFLQMLLLDGCFILLTLCKVDFIFSDHKLLLPNENKNPSDPWQYYYVKNDLMFVGKSNSILL